MRSLLTLFFLCLLSASVLADDKSESSSSRSVSDPKKVLVIKKFKSLVLKGNKDLKPFIKEIRIPSGRTAPVYISNEKAEEQAEIEARVKEIKAMLERKRPKNDSDKVHFK